MSDDVFDVSTSSHYVGDCRTLLKRLPDRSVQTIVTSPPYYGLRDYGLQGQIGLEETLVEFIETLVVDVFREARRVLADDGTLWVNIGDSYAGTGSGAQGATGATGATGAMADRAVAQNRLSPKSRRLSAAAKGPRADNRRSTLGGGKAHQDAARIGRAARDAKPKDLLGVPWEIAFALRDDGWYLRNDIIWEKENPMPESVTDRCTKAHEYLFLFSKSETYYYNADAIRSPLAAKTYTTYTAERRTKGDPNERSSELVASVNWARDVPTRRPKTDSEGNIVGANKRDVWHDEPRALDGEPLTHLEYAIAQAMLWTAAAEALARGDKTDVWTVATQPYDGAHFATFPPKLIEPCILAGSRPGDLVLDPFFGSGTTGAVAEKHGRRWIGFDLGYEELAKARTAQRSLVLP